MNIQSSYRQFTIAQYDAAIEALMRLEGISRHQAHWKIAQAREAHYEAIAAHEAFCHLPGCGQDPPTPFAVDEVARLEVEFTEEADALEMAWVLIANAYDGDWDKAQDHDWKIAAERWRDNYHAA